MYSISQRDDFVKHLNDKHQTNELTDYKNCELLEKNFNINLENENGWCKICAGIISYKKLGLYFLINHYEMIHSTIDNINTFCKAVKIKNGREILDKFLLMDKKATCVSCKQEMNIEHLNEHTANILGKLAEHFFSHDRYEDNFFIFDKTIENRFCFTFFFFPIIIRYETYCNCNQFSIKIVNYC